MTASNDPVPRSAEQVSEPRPLPRPLDAPRRFCDEYIDLGGDGWSGTYCKLLAGHDGDCSPSYPRHGG